MSSTKETILDVQGMTCGSCVRHVEGALKGLAGIEAVAVELAKGKVKVQHDPAAAPLERMVDALAEAGYEARAAAGGGA